jgi:hypothetical protein
VWLLSGGRILRILGGFEKGEFLQDILGFQGDFCGAQ